MLIRRESVLYISLAIICLFLAFLSTSYDYDFFARIIVGEQFLEAGILPYKDFLSYTPTHSWYDHEWGAGVIFYTVLKYLKPFGLLLLQAILMFGTVFFVLKTQNLQKHKFPTSILFLTTFLFLFAKINPSIIRCQMFSFFFFSFYLFLMEKYRKTPNNLIWLILPTTILWNNIHGGVVAGLGLVFLYLVSAICRKLAWKKLFVVFSLSSIALIINPYKINYLNFLLYATTKHREYINEWWNFLNPSVFGFYSPASLFIIGMICIYLYISIKKRKIDYTKLFVLLICGIQGLLHVKLLSLGLIVVTSLCYGEIIQVTKFAKKYLQLFEKKLYFSICILVLLLPCLSPQIARVNLNKLPFFETEFLNINNIKGNAVVPFGYGSYISYKLYPNIKIYMDGRYEEVYNDQEFLALRDFSWAENGWEDFLTKYNTEIIIVEKFYKIFSTLKENANWTLIYEGNLCGVFIKKALAKDNYKQPTLEKKYYQKNIFNNKGYFNKNNLHEDSK